MNCSLVINWIKQKPNCLLAFATVLNSLSPGWANDPPLNLKELARVKGKHYALAIQYRREKKFDLAKQEYSYCIKDQPGDLSLYLMRGDMEIFTKDYSGAAADANQVLKLSRLKSLTARAHVLHAQADSGLNKTDIAILHYQQASELKPGDQDIQFELGKLLSQKNRYDEALVNLNNARDTYLKYKDNLECVEQAAKAEALISQIRAKLPR